MSSTDFTFLETLDRRTASSNPDLLISAALHLMSQYKTNTAEEGPCLKLASVIERHLQALADIPSLPPVLRATCQNLSEQWAEMVDRELPEPVRPSLLSRLGLRA